MVPQKWEEFQVESKPELKNVLDHLKWGRNRGSHDSIFDLCPGQVISGVSRGMLQEVECAYSTTEDQSDMIISKERRSH